MRVTLLRPAQVCDDGITIRLVPAGVGEVPDHLVDGLRAEGFIAPDGAAPETKVVGPAPEAKVVIPPHWRALHWKRRVALAEQVSGRRGLTSDEAAAILGEATR